MTAGAIALGAVLGYSVGSATVLVTTVLTEYRVNGREGVLDMVTRREDMTALAAGVLFWPSLFAYCLKVDK